MVANEATDRGRITQAIQSIEQSTADGDISDALKLAGKLAERARGAEILVVTDDAGSTLPPMSALDAPVASWPPSASDATTRPSPRSPCSADPSGLKRTLFVSVANYSTSAGRAAAPDPGRRHAGHGPRSVPRSAEQAPTSSSTSCRPARASSRHASSTRTAMTTPIPDRRPPAARRRRLGDRAAGPAATRPAGRPGQRLHRQNALIAAAQRRALRHDLRRATPHDRQRPEFASYDLVVFDGCLPAHLPSKSILAFAPPTSQSAGRGGRAAGDGSAWASCRSTIRCCAASTCRGCTSPATTTSRYELPAELGAHGHSRLGRPAPLRGSA